MPQYQAGAYEDTRTTLVYDDCKKYLEDYKGTFDVIVLDLADPVEAGPAFPIWTKEYYTTCAEKLSPDGARHAYVNYCPLLTWTKASGWLQERALSPSLSIRFLIFVSRRRRRGSARALLKLLG